MQALAQTAECTKLQKKMGFFLFEDDPVTSCEPCPPQSSPLNSQCSAKSWAQLQQQEENTELTMAPSPKASLLAKVEKLLPDFWT